MAKNEEYNGSIDIISGLRPKNGAGFPIAEAADILTGKGGKRLDADLAEIFAQLLTMATREYVNTKTGGYTWYVDTDAVVNRLGEECGTLTDCMTDDHAGTWFYAVTTSSEAGSAAYPSKYTIDGANGYINLRDYVVWTGKRLVRVNTYEAKSSTLKNSDGKYSSKSGVDGLMSSVDKAYLTDLINEYWGKNKLPVYPDPDPAEGWQTNWLFDTGWYLGGIKKNCGGHPPVLNDNHTSWAVLVLNGMNTDANSINHNHRVEIAFDLVNSKCYMRRGWMSSNAWADNWDEVGQIADGSVTKAKLSEDLLNLLSGDGVLVIDDSNTSSDTATDFELALNIRDVIVRTTNSINLYVPKDAWYYWNVCVINEVENTAINPTFYYWASAESDTGREEGYTALSDTIDYNTNTMLRFTYRKPDHDYPYNLSNVDRRTRLPEVFVGSVNIEFGAVTEDKIADGSVTEEKISGVVLDRMTEVIECKESDISLGKHGYAFSGDYTNVRYVNNRYGGTCYLFPDKVPERTGTEHYKCYHIEIFQQYEQCEECEAFAIAFDVSTAGHYDVDIVYDFVNSKWRVTNYVIKPYEEATT